MLATLTLAKRGLGRVWPNPAVGCVIVQGDRVVGRGWTQPGGRPHAEAMALAQAADGARGAIAYVSLEPCAHHGRTPPCCDALIAAGVARVVCPMTDPDPRVAGQGFERMRDAGVTVDIGLMAEDAVRVNEGFLRRIQTGRPHVTLKLATSLDGRIATASGESQWITGPAARARVHLLRAQSDAIMVGAGTARADTPSLNVRLPRLEGQSPIRIILGGSADDDQPPQLAKADAEAWHLHRANATPMPGAKSVVAVDIDGDIDLDALVTKLGAEGLTRVFCEGGGAVAAGLLNDDLVDELIWMTAGVTIGADGRPATGALPFGPLAAAPRFDLDRVEVLDGDVVSTWRRQRQIQA